MKKPEYYSKYFPADYETRWTYDLSDDEWYDEYLPSMEREKGIGIMNLAGVPVVEPVKIGSNDDLIRFMFANKLIRIDQKAINAAIKLVGDSLNMQDALAILMKSELSKN